jgi:phosphoribosyl-ATP pyrophosphohydrolase/phosphoribosyl-AMP cyclohydrolase
MNSTGNPENINFLVYLQDIIDQRKVEMPEGSYTSGLFQKGLNDIARKVGEEAVELVIESSGNNDSYFLNEAADLLYHLLVLLAARNYRIEDVIEVLRKRHKK